MDHKTGKIIKRMEINTPFIKLDKFLKWAAISSTGGEARYLIEEGKVLVNKQVEKVHGRKLYEGDLVEIENVGSWRVKIRS